MNIRFLKDELWYGGAVKDGIQMPFDKITSNLKKVMNYYFNKFCINASYIEIMNNRLNNLFKRLFL